MDVLRSSLLHGPRTAILAEGPAYRPLPGRPLTDGPRVALFCESGADYVADTFGTWMRGSIAVPLCLEHPDRELLYVLEDAEVWAVLGSKRQADRLHALAESIGGKVDVVDSQQQQNAKAAREGALHTHCSLAAEVNALCETWRWEQQDRALHTLLLHRIHGVVNGVLCLLATGACIQMVPKFLAANVWQHLQLQLTVSGSAACPTPIMQRWEQLSGEKLLGQYGMTGTGMLLGNPYRVLEDGYYKLLGRTSVDVIKHGGYKISELHIESVLLEHPKIAEPVVLGLPDETCGENITAVVALKAGGNGTASLSRQDYLPPYQLPRLLKVMEKLKHNAIGKVNKKALQQELFPAAVLS